MILDAGTRYAGFWRRLLASLIDTLTLLLDCRVVTTRSGDNEPTPPILDEVRRGL